MELRVERMVSLCEQEVFTMSKANSRCGVNQNNVEVYRHETCDRNAMGTVPRKRGLPLLTLLSFLFNERLTFISMLVVGTWGGCSWCCRA